MDTLNDFELEVLFALPPEPNGYSFHDLANDVLGNRGQKAIGKVRRAILVIAEVLGDIYIRRGDDDFGHADVPLFGVKAADVERVREFFEQISRRVAENTEKT